MDIDNFSNDESDLEIYLDLNLIGQLCLEIQSLSVEMAFVDFKSDKTESSSSIFQKLTELHLKGNKYRDVSVLPSLLADTPSLARLSIQVSVVHLDVEDFSEELLWCLLCHKEPASRIQSPLLGAFCLLLAGSLWHKRHWQINTIELSTNESRTSLALDQ